MYAAIKIIYFSICLISEVWIRSSELGVLISSPVLIRGALSIRSFHVGVGSSALEGILSSLHGSSRKGSTAISV